MVSERLKILFGNVKKRLGEIKPEDVAKIAVKEAVGAIPIVGSIIKDAIDEFSPDEKEELIEELKELSEIQFKEISEKVGVSVEYLKDIQGIALYTFEELHADHEEIIALLRHLIEIQPREVKPPEIDIPTIQSVLRKGETFEGDFFKKVPEWIDFEEGFVVARKEVDEVIKK
jgi:Asp-tRNA(Asn)/Glu-tRNA(Gln) amidotransferase C subunit